MQPLPDVSDAPIGSIAYGINTDDTTDFRPGHRAASEHDYRFSSIVLGVVRSDSFQMMRARAVPEAEPQQGI